MPIEIAKPEDYPTIAAIYNEYIELGNATMEEQIHNADDIAAWVKKFNEKEKLFALKENEKVIGWGIIKRYSDRKGYRFAGETAVYLASSKLGKGYGTQMKKFLIQECRALDYRHLVAKIFSSNEGSIQYNLKLGYTIVGIQKEIGFKNNQWQDVAIMQLILNDGTE